LRAASGIDASCGEFQRITMAMRSAGAAGMYSRKNRKTLPAWFIGYITMHIQISGPTGWS
jgi:hypothetical protein